MTAAILLAGGASRRFGRAKLLEVLPSGLSLAQASAAALRAVLPDVLAVVRPGDEVLATQFREAGCDVHFAERAPEGLGASLAAGISQRAGSTGWLIALADMPLVTPRTVHAVAEALAAGALLAAPVQAGRRGHPVGFAAGLREELLALSGDTGARAVIERHARDLVEVPVEDRGIHVDVDVPADLAGTR